jgi:translation initiation factor IF-3
VAQVRVIDAENEQLGILATADALDRARDAGLDLVEVAPGSEPPVCRIMDYGKWKYDQKKRDHKSRMKQHHVVLKEVRLRPKIEEHDQMVKMKKARGFLEKGGKVQFTMLFRGREMAHLDLAMNIFNHFESDLSDIGKVEMPARQQGRRMTMVMAPSAAKN